MTRTGSQLVVSNPAKGLPYDELHRLLSEHFGATVTTLRTTLGKVYAITKAGVTTVSLAAEVETELTAGFC